MKKVLALVFAMLMVLSVVACSSGSGDATTVETPSNPVDKVVSGVEAIDTVASDGVDYNHMSMDELYELAKKEGGVVEVYAVTADANTAIKKFSKAYPDIKMEYISCDTDTVAAKIEMEADTGNVNADILMVKDNSGEIYNQLVAYDYLEFYYPATVCAHIDPDMLKYGLPMYATFNPWYYNTEKFPEGPGIESWWDIVSGYNVDTKSFTDANGNNTQNWVIYSKDIAGPSYSSLFAQMMIDSDDLAAQYKAQYGEDLVYTYADALNNTPGIMELPEENAGVELFWRFTRMAITELSDGDGVVEAVDRSDPRSDLPNAKGVLGLTSASKLDNAEQGYKIAWVYGLKPYTAFTGCNYSYVVSGTDNPAASRLFILYMMGGDDGASGCYQAFDGTGHWSVRDDVKYVKTDLTDKDIVLTTPDFDQIYSYYPNVKAYWTYWRSLAK